MFKRPHLSFSPGVDKRSIERIESVAHNVGVYVWGGYQVFVVLVMLNLLISLMTTTFARIQQNADSEWKFTRYLIHNFSWWCYAVQGCALVLYTI